ncbi:MAG: gliding motility protein GldL [Bacteroidota bacterium]|jgi:archaellum component FlaC
MGKKYRRYKNFLEKFLDSASGKRFFNIIYSVGAAIVILGAMFKILHLPYGNQMLMIGMITEACVFLLSAFEKPAKEYKWEEVYPILADNEDFVPKVQREAIQRQEASTSNSPAIQSTATPSSRPSSTSSDSNSATTTQTPNLTSTQPSTGGAALVRGAAVVIGGGGSQSSNVSEVQETTSGSPLSGNITIVNGANSGGASSPDSSNTLGTSEEYADQLSQMAHNMDKFATVTESLAKISDSFQSIIGYSEGIGNNTQGYVTQMEALNRNLAGLNTIYEIQLKGVSGQINTIEHINAGLDRIKKLYDGSLADSSIFKNETEKMALQLAELNRVYARLLQAMTSTTNMGGGFNPNTGSGNI